jgi:flagellar motor switch protein FliN/FliY
MADEGAGAGVALERSRVNGVTARVEKAGATSMAKIEQHSQWPLLQRLPMKLQVSIPLPKFKVRDLLALRKGVMIESVWQSSEDIPLAAGGVQLGWGEFEVVERRMAVRLTRLA